MDKNIQITITCDFFVIDKFSNNGICGDCAKQESEVRDRFLARTGLATDGITADRKRHPKLKPT